MATYTIRQSSVAALITVLTPDGAEYSCIYIADKKPIEVYRVPYLNKDATADLPLSVRAAVSRDFGVTFSLPHDGIDTPRSRHVSNTRQNPYTIEV